MENQNAPDSILTKKVKECICEKIGISKTKSSAIDLDKFPEAVQGCLLSIHERERKVQPDKTKEDYTKDYEGYMKNDIARFLKDEEYKEGKEKAKHQWNY